MRLHRTLLTVCVIMLLLLLAASPYSNAADKKPGTRFSGNVQFGAMWSNSTNQLRVFDTNETTDDLNSPADSYNIVFPIVLFDLKYRIKDNTTLHAGTPIDEYGIRLNAGVAHSLGDPGQLDFSVFWSPMHEEWQDPYIAGQDREETSALDAGLELKYTHIMGTGFQFRGLYSYIDLDKDLIGERFEDLQRDGTKYTANIGYAIQLNQANRIVPAIDYTRGQMDGASSSYNSYRLILNYLRFTRQYMLNAYIGGGTAKYDKEHPLYGKTRQDNSIGGFAILTWFNPFDWQRIFFSFGAGAGYSDANIDFYDSRSFSTLMSVGYNF